MKKLARILALVLACALLFTLVTACDNGQSGTSQSSSAGSGDTQEDGSGTEGNGSAEGEDGSGDSGNAGVDDTESYQVDFYYPCWWTQPTDEGTAGVEEVINEHLTELGYNDTLKLHWVSLFEYGTQIDLILASGEKVDLCKAGTYGQIFENMVSNGYLEPLDPYLDPYMSETVELLGNWLECGRTGGVTYAIPAHKGLEIIRNAMV